MLFHFERSAIGGDSHFHFHSVTRDLGLGDNHNRLCT
jgi:hypothetical protein